MKNTENHQSTEDLSSLTPPTCWVFWRKFCPEPFAFVFNKRSWRFGLISKKCKENPKEFKKLKKWEIKLLFGSVIIFNHRYFESGLCDWLEEPLRHLPKAYHADTYLLECGYSDKLRQIVKSYRQARKNLPPSKYLSRKFYLRLLFVVLYGYLTRPLSWLVDGCFRLFPNVKMSHEDSPQ